MSEPTTSSNNKEETVYNEDDINEIFQDMDINLGDSAARYWAFTQFNYNKEYTPFQSNTSSRKGKEPMTEKITYEEGIKKFFVNYCCYGIYGHEETEKGKPHLQGAFVLRDKKRFNFIKKYTNNEIHLKKMDKCLLANIIYCSKGTNIQEHMDPNFKKPTKNNKRKRSENNKYDQALEETKKGKFENIDSEILIKHFKNLQQIQYITMSKEVSMNLYLGSKYGNYFKNHFLWIQGDTNTLKSYNGHKFCEYLYDFIKRYNKKNGLPEPNPDIWLTPYIKDLNKWYQSWKHQKLMLIEEVDLTFCKNNVSRFKRWFDQYAFPAEYKGGDTGLIRPEFIVVTSNYSMKECFTQDGIDFEKDYLPMKRRILEINLTKKARILWPNLRLLNIEYNSKPHIIQEDLKYKIETEKLMGMNKEETFTNRTCLNPHEIEYYFNNMQTHVYLDEEENQDNNQILALDSHLLEYQAPELQLSPINNNKTIIAETQESNKILNCIVCYKNRVTSKSPICDDCNKPERENICSRCRKHIPLVEKPICKSCIDILKNIYNHKFTNSFSIESESDIETVLIDDENSFYHLDNKPSTPPTTIEESFDNFSILSPSAIDNIVKEAEKNNKKEKEKFTIPQFDGADDLLEEHLEKKVKYTPYINKYGRKYYTKNHEITIEYNIKKIEDLYQEIEEIQSKVTTKTTIDEIRNYRLNIINKYNKIITIYRSYGLYKYNYKLKKRFNKCWYCKHKVINQCSCYGIYYNYNLENKN